jgi:arginine:pyruvate transaminase
MRPEGGMFGLMDIRGTGVASAEFAHDLPIRERVAVLPRDSFEPSAAGHLRISLTAAESRLAEAGGRLVRCAHSIAG